MDTEQIITALKSERDRLDRAISILNGSSRVTQAGSRSSAPRRRRGPRNMSAEARARIAAAQRRRWAKVKAAQGRAQKKK